MWKAANDLYRVSYQKILVFKDILFVHQREAASFTLYVCKKKSIHSFSLVEDGWSAYCDEKIYMKYTVC